MEIADIFISGGIGEEVTLLDVVSQVRNQPNAESYRVHINSEGGYVDTGFQIHDYIKSLKKPVHTIGEGLVASIATVIHMAGDTRSVMPNTQYMIHLPWGGVEGTADEVDNYGEMLRDAENRVLKFYTDNTGNTKEAILPLLQEETWLEANDLMTLGFITELPQRIAAKAIINTKDKKMENKVDEAKFFDRLKKALGLSEEAKSQKVVFAADQTEVVFDALEADDTISVGDAATIDGSPASGEVLLSDGRTIVFDAGVVTEIVDTEVVEEDEEEMAEMKKQLEELSKKFEAQTEVLNKVKAENDKNKKVIQNIEKIRSEFEGKKKETPKKEEQKISRVAAALANRKVNHN